MDAMDRFHWVAPIAHDWFLSDPDDGVLRLVKDTSSSEKPSTWELWYERPLPSAGQAEWTVAYRLIGRNGHPTVAEMRVFPYEQQQTRRRGSDGNWVEAPSKPRRRPFGPGTWSGRPSSVPESGGLPSRLLRKIQIQQHLALVIAEVLPELRSLADPEIFESLFGRPGIEINNKALTRPPHPGRRGHSDLYLARIAQTYRECLQKDSRKPTALLAEVLGLEYSHVNDLLKAARERGLLTRGRQGVPGGDLTDKAEGILREAESEAE